VRFDIKRRTAMAVRKFSNITTLLLSNSTMSKINIMQTNIESKYIDNEPKDQI
jgi:hypothetical protein